MSDSTHGAVPPPARYESLPDTTPPLPTWQRNLAVISVIATTFMGTLDVAIVNIAIPQLSRNLHASPSDTVWVATAYLLATACGVPATSALGDQVGRRRLFLIGVPLFTLASLGCALSPNLGTLVTFRAFQGLGTAVLLAVTLPVLRGLFPPEKLGTIMGVNAMVVALGTCAGPTAGGLILGFASWPWLFLINIPLGAAAFALGWYAVPRAKPQAGDFDWQGAVLGGAAAVAFLLGMRDLADVTTLWRSGLLLAACAVLVVFFLRRERRAVRPVIPLPMWNGLFSLSVTTAFWSFFGQGVAFVALPFLFQSAYGATPLQSALLFTPWPVAVMIVAPFSGRLADRMRPSVLALSGLVVYLAGLTVIALLGDNPPTWLVLCATGLAGLGFGIFQSPNNREMQGAAPRRYASSAAAVLNINRNVAQSAGSGAVSVALVLTGAVAGSAALEAHAATSVLWVAVAGALFSVVISAVKLRTVVAAGS